MTAPIDVLAAGRHMVTTASGARYVIEARDGDRSPTITRLTQPTADADGPFRLVDLRRDSQPIRLVAVEHLQDGVLRTGVVVGEDMWLTLEPLADWADVTVRRSTPVTRIDPLPDDVRIADA